MAIITNYLLFNHTYLRQLQADGSADEEAASAAQGMRDWYGFKEDTSTGALVQSWVAPLLQILELELQPLRTDQAANDAHVHLLYTAWDHERQTPVGLCYVTPPGADLDATTKGRHWMAQAVLAARHSPSPIRNSELAIRNSELAIRWVILTNGDQWRLLDAQALRRYEAYLQVNLGELARNPGDLSALRVFYHCFHRSAFEQNERNKSGLDSLLAASGRATKRAEDHLKARVSDNEGIMARLCLGLVQATGKSRFDEAERDAIYRDATYLLYRVLFILYAEARGLLPVEEPAYRAASLAGLVETAYEYKVRGIPDPGATTLWERLKRLCTAIYESDAELSIPAYNGGLFDDGDKLHLRAGSVADAYLSEALFDLAYISDGSAPEGYRRIDYRDLSVRHLGSIYEGMIEYKLQIAEETLWARRDKKDNVRFLRTGQNDAPRRTDVEIKQGDVYFSQSPGERRATGTYYTPEYVVDYIVHQAVVRGLEERRAPLEEKLAGWLEEIAAATDLDERARMQRTADEELLRFVEEQVLTFRVCDIGMGSGHFLVNSGHQMTNFIVETLHLTPWKPVLSGAEGNEEIDINPAAWRRRVVEQCLYGVDLSLMAVELAKLSLWLASVARGKPLSFLDHHLRQGNSLIGARLEDLAEVLAGVVSTKPSRKERKARAAGQLSMLDDPAFSQHVTAATSLLDQISTRVVERVEDVKAQETDYEQVRAELEPYRQLADLWIARHFDVKVDERQLHAISKYLVNGAVSPVPKYQRLLTEVQKLADEQHFFHWELEFPSLSGGQGFRLFSVIVGNPPWGYMRALPNERLYWENTYGALQASDTFALFVERATQLLKSGALLGMLLSSGWQTANSGLPLRELLAPCVRFIEFVNLPYDVFPDAYVDAMTMILRISTLENTSALQSGTLRKLTFNRREKISDIDDQDSRWESFDYGIWFSPEIQRFHGLVFPTFVRANELPIFRDALQKSVKLGAITEVQRGISPYHLVDKPASSRYFPAIDGELRRYRYTYTGEKYVEYHDGIAEYKPKELFTGTRVLLRQLISRQFRLQAICTDQFFLNNQSIQVIKPQSPGYSAWYLLAIINSKFLSHYHLRMSALALRDDFPKLVLDDTRCFPIPRIRFVTPPRQRELQKKEAQELYNACLSGGSVAPLLKLVDDCLQPIHSPDWTLVEKHNTDPFNEDSQILSNDLVEHADVIHDLLSYLAEQMIGFSKERQRLGFGADLFYFVQRDSPCPQLDKALGSLLSAGEIVSDLSAVRHDIEGLRLSQEEAGRWLLEVRAKLRDPESGWRKHQRDRDGNLVRQWLPAYRLPLDEATGRFYRYAFAHLRGFDGAGRFPGGYTRTTLQKLHATKVPQFVPVDLVPLERLEAELAEVRRKIQLTDDLIDQIVYKLYGLTEEEIAIVEARV